MNKNKFDDYYDPVLSRDAINILTGLSTMFTNSECLVVEYNDIINMPYFLLLTSLCNWYNEETDKEYFPKLEELVDLSLESVLEFYINRKHQNFIIDIMPDNLAFDEDEMNHYLMTLVNKYENYFLTDIDLSFSRAITDIIHNKFVKKIVFYYPEECEYVVDDIHNKYGRSNLIDIRFGKFEDAVRNLSLDTTYVLSDANKVVLLDDMDRLRECTVMVPYEYGYNYTDKLNEEFILSEDYFKEKNIHFTRFCAI